MKGEGKEEEKGRESFQEDKRRKSRVKKEEEERGLLARFRRALGFRSSKSVPMEASPSNKPEEKAAKQQGGKEAKEGKEGEGEEGKEGTEEGWPTAEEQEEARKRMHELKEKNRVILAELGIHFSRLMGKLGFDYPPPEDIRPFQEINEVLSTLQTFDLILFSCPDSRHSMLVQGGKWTHVAMVYRRAPPYSPRRDILNPADQILMLESLIGHDEDRTFGVDLVTARKRFFLLFFFLFSLLSCRSAFLKFFLFSPFLI